MYSFYAWKVGSGSATCVMRKWMVKQFQGLPAMLCLLSLPVAADFSHSAVSLHPTYPGANPFIISISGIWPTDCHPGEQLPVVRSFDGHTVEIEFEIIVVHVTCNETETPYRSLVDMYEIVDISPPLNQTLRIHVTFDGAKLEQSLDLVCPDGEDCSNYAGSAVLPERGLYFTTARAREGLLVARQNQTTVLYPLVYNEAGNAQWLFGAAQSVDATFFAPLTRWHGGDCFDCEPSGAQAQPTNAGHISALVAGPDSIWVQLNERPFSEYHKLVYGYEVFVPGGEGHSTDLSGRWALRENHGTDPPLGDLSEILPPAFEIALDYIVESDGDSPTLTSVVYLVTSITGQELGQLVCELRSVSGGNSDSCSFIDSTDEAEPLLLFYPKGPSNLSIVYGRPLPAIGTPPGGTAIRLD